MKKIIKNIAAVSFLALLMVSCRKEELNPVPTLEAGIYSQGKQNSGSFIEGDDAASVVNMQVKWIDVNRKLTMSKQEIFVTFYQDYIDKNDNPAVADHGTKSFKVMDCGANNVPVKFDISAADVYGLFSSAQFNYGNGSVDVFDGSRPAGARFKTSDYFMMTWGFTGSNGLSYKWWSISIADDELLYFADPNIASNAKLYWGVE